MHQGKLIVTDASVLLRPAKPGQYPPSAKHDTARANEILDLGDLEYDNVWHIITPLDQQTAARVLRQVFYAYVDYYCMSKLWADARAVYKVNGKTQFVTEHGFEDGDVNLFFNVHCNVEADEVDSLITDITESDVSNEFVLVSPDVEHGYTVQEVVSSPEDDFDEFDDPLDEFDDPYDDEEEVSPASVYARALRHFGGNAERANEAMAFYPGDFM